MKRIISAIATLFLPAVVYAASIDTIQFIKIAPQDARAVIKGSDGKLQVIKPGDTVAENMTVKEIAPGRIVLEEKTERGLETLIVRMDNGKSRIERIRNQPEKRQPLVAPAVPIQ